MMLRQSNGLISEKEIVQFCGTRGTILDSEDYFSLLTSHLKHSNAKPDISVIELTNQ